MFLRHSLSQNLTPQSRPTSDMGSEHRTQTQVFRKSGEEVLLLKIR
jgi:hypothetical protein